MEFLFVSIAVAALLMAVVAGWALTLLGMPGNWLAVAAASLYAWLGPSEGVLQIGWGTVAALVVLAAAGEIAELVASVWGAQRAGGSRRAALFSIFGSFVGAIVGATLGIPIPLIGSAVAAVLGGAVGALAGAALGEQSRGEALGRSLRVGHAAFWGRLLGTAAKSAVATTLALAIGISLLV